MAQKGGGQPGGSMHEGLQGILGMLGPLMAAPDADVQFLSQLQQVIVGRLKASTQHAMQAPGGPPGGGQPGPGQGNQIAPGGGAGPVGLQSGGVSGMGGPGAGGPPGGPQPGPGGPGGLGAPNPDELRRVLGGAGGPG